MGAASPSPASGKAIDLVGALEALLFSSGEPLSIRRLAEVLQVTEPVIKAAAARLAELYAGEGRGVELRQLADTLQFVTVPAYGPQIQRLRAERRPPLSHAALETLAVVAYRQPITRGEIEHYRGVNCERALQTLLERQLLVEKGRRPGPGRPKLYGTSQQFLNYFGLNSLADLPQLDIPDLSQQDETDPTTTDPTA